MTQDISFTPKTWARTYRVIWASFGAAPFVYTVVLLVTISTTADNVIAANSLLPQIITPAALTCAGLSIWWRQRYNSGPAISSTEPGRDQLETLGKACIVAWALSEAVAILGLTLGIMTARVDVALPFLSGAVVLFYLHRPSAWMGFPR